MYDNLDDPSPPLPGAAERSAVARRASRLRRRRLLVLGASGTALVAVLVVAVVNLGTGSSSKASLLIASPSPTATSEATPSLTPSVAPSASTPATQQATSVAVRSGTPSASPSCTAFRFDCPDRRSGWSSGFHSCSGAVAPSDGAGSPPIEGLTITLSVPQSAPAGPDLHGTATVTNHSSVTVSFEVRQPRSGLRAIVSGSTSDGTAPTDAEGTEPFQLAPGASDSVGVTALTTECGDTSRDQVQPLPAGSYRIGVTISYDRAQLVQDATGSPEPSATPGASARASGSWSAATTITLR